MPEAADPDVARFPGEVARLVEGFLHDGGCPCRFPRFRATVERETAALGAEMSTWGRDQLIALYDARVPLVDAKGTKLGREGRCKRCGAHVDRWSREPTRDRWIDHLRITPAPGSVDLGAPVDGLLPRCWPFFVVDGDTRATVEAEVQYPRRTVDEWLAWMRQPRPQGTSGTPQPHHPGGS